MTRPLNPDPDSNNRMSCLAFKDGTFLGIQRSHFQRSAAIPAAFFLPAGSRRSSSRIGERTNLAAMLDMAVLPRKSKLSAINQKIEKSEAFKAARRRHSAVESAINALENHGLNRCPDHGIEGFKRYIALTILARNIQIIGHMLQQKEVKKSRCHEKHQQKAA